MAYRDNWQRHLLAPFVGEGFSNELARDFWRKEDLWNPSEFVRLRWSKLVLVYSVSALTQVTLAMLLVVAVIDLFIKDVPLRWWWIVVGGVTAVALVFAVLIATTTYASIWRKMKGGNEP